MTDNQLTKLVDILMNKYDARLVVQELATGYPDIFVSIIESINNSVPAEKPKTDDYDEVIKEIARHVMKGDNVKAICALRKFSGLSLTESKLIVDQAKIRLVQSYEMTRLLDPFGLLYNAPRVNLDELNDEKRDYVLAIVNMAVWDTSTVKQDDFL